MVIFVYFFLGSMPSCTDKDAQTLYNECVNILCASLPETTRFCQLINIYIEECMANAVEIRLHLHGICDDGINSFFYC